MTPESDSGLKVGKRIARYYAELPEVAGVVLGGSAARGTADPNSDLDLFIFCHDHPGERFRSEVVAGLHGEGWKQHGNKLDRGILRDCFHAAGHRIDIEHVRVGSCESAIRRCHVPPRHGPGKTKASSEDCSTPIHCMTPGLSKNGSRGSPGTRMACSERCSRGTFP